MDQDEEVTQVLEAMLEGWDADQWTHGTFQDEDGRTCLMGRARETFRLLRQTRSVNPQVVWGRHRDTVENRLVRVITEQYGEHWARMHCTVAAWNDAPGRRYEEVERVLEKAIAL
jgi:hypothetical protein